MARGHTAALLAALLIAALGTATAQAPGPAAAAAAPASAPVAAGGPAAAAGPATDIATTQTVGSGSSAVAATGVAPASSQLAGGELPNNRTIGTQLVIPPGGCFIVSVTSATDRCLQDSSFSVNSQSIAIPADYRAAGIADSNSFFDNAAYQANNSQCQSAGNNLTQIYEASGCILSSAAADTVGASAATDIQNSFVCNSSGTDTTNYARAFGANAQERRLCSVAIQNAQRSIAAGTGSSASGDPCTASRATFIIPNPCPTSNTTVNTTGRFFLAPDLQAPPPAELAPVAAPGAAPGDAPELAPDAAPALAPAPATSPAADNATAAGAAGAGSALAPSSTAPAPAPQSASRAAAFGAAAAVATLACAALV